MTEHIQIVKSIDTEFLRAELRSDGIVHIHLKTGTLVTVELQVEMENIYNQITDIPRPFLFTGEEFVSVTTEARSNSIAMEDRVPILGTALITRNLGQQILADYYYKFNRPKKPLLVTRKFEKGVKWALENFNIPPIPSN